MQQLLFELRQDVALTGGGCGVVQAAAYPASLLHLQLRNLRARVESGTLSPEAAAGEHLRSLLSRRLLGAMR